MKNIDCARLGLNELDEKELNKINGGDKFMNDVGYALGYAWDAFADFMGSMQTEQVRYQAL